MTDFKELEVRMRYAEDVLMRVFTKIYKNISPGGREHLETWFIDTLGDKVSVYSGDSKMYMRERFERMANTIKENERTGF